MNLSPDWGALLASHGWGAAHWSQIGPGNAKDIELLQWARDHGCVVLTQDLDFSQLLFATGQDGPSVALLRMDNEFDANARNHVCNSLKAAEGALDTGALLTITNKRVRLRHLPLGS